MINPETDENERESKIEYLQYKRYIYYNIFITNVGIKTIKFSPERGKVIKSDGGKRRYGQAVSLA